MSIYFMRHSEEVHKDDSPCTCYPNDLKCMWCHCMAVVRSEVGEPGAYDFESKIERWVKWKVQKAMAAHKTATGQAIAG